MYGYKVIATMNNITDLTPTRGFVAQLTTASIVVLSSGLGLPVSTTHIFSWVVFWAWGLQGIDAINVHVVRNIFLSWFVTFSGYGAIYVLLSDFADGIKMRGSVLPLSACPFEINILLISRFAVPSIEIDYIM